MEPNSNNVHTLTANQVCSSVTLALPDSLKKLLKSYFIVTFFVNIIYIFILIRQDGALDELFTMMFFFVPVTFIVGTISLFKCIRDRHILTAGQKILDWIVSIF